MSQLISREIFKFKPQPLLSNQLGLTSKDISNIFELPLTKINEAIKRDNIGIYDFFNKFYVLTSSEAEKFIIKHNSIENDRFLYYSMLSNELFVNCLLEVVPDYLMFIKNYEENKVSLYIEKTKFPFEATIDVMPHVLWVYNNINLFENIDIDDFWCFWGRRFFLYQRAYGANFIFESYLDSLKTIEKKLGFIYVIEIQYGKDKLCKVGWSSRPLDRFKQFTHIKILKYFIFNEQVEKSVELSFHLNNKSIIYNEWYSNSFDYMKELISTHISTAIRKQIDKK